MDKFVPFVSSINTNLIAPVFERINYLRNSRDSIKDLRSSIQNLKLRMNGEGTSTAPGNAGQVDTDAMKKWREDVREIEKEANAIEEEYIQGTCVKNCWSIYEVSKKSVNLKKRADDLKPPELSVAPSQSSTAQIQNQPLISTESSPLQQLVYHICHPESRIIAVHGMQGVGKTTLVRIINSHFIKENSRFDTVIMVTVSATLNIQDIRTRIGERLGLDLSNSSEDGARDELSKALWRKKFLLILDDVRQQLDLKNVGIIQTGRSEKGSKIVLTTQNQDVRKDTTVNVAIEVQPLSGDEAWTLFVEKAGRHVTVNPIKALAERIVRWCEGLPLAIVIVARAMANRHGVQEWKKAATQIEESVGL
ncbi:hypothetical protein NE237_026431 [Protea cynaroides]|uniref:AAA+ ATPase domain-containing protein n=1 Tax=Protea cynaroides TaxID=273540 RepID=A0A9Q0H733_9MAGN|nr:hypothetical protein NE237_026431 [Protea cynaroides]